MSGPRTCSAAPTPPAARPWSSFWFGAGLDRHGRFAVQAPGDVVAGALGAFPHRDGVDIGGAWWWPNNPSGNVEEWEDALPILYLYRRERARQRRRRDAGAAATRSRRRSRCTRRDEMLVQIISVDNAVNCAIGLGGGLPAAPGRLPLPGGRRSPPSGWRAAGCPDRAPSCSEALGELPRVFAKDLTTMHPGDVFVARVQRRRRLRRPAGARPRSSSRATWRAGVLPRATSARSSTASCWRRTVTPDASETAALRDRRASRAAAGGRARSGPATSGSIRRAAGRPLRAAAGLSARTHATASCTGLCPSAASRLGAAQRQLQGRRGAAGARAAGGRPRASTSIRRSSAMTPTSSASTSARRAGSALATELCRPDDPPVLDVRIDGWDA